MASSIYIRCTCEKMFLLATIIWVKITTLLYNRTLLLDDSYQSNKGFHDFSPSLYNVKQLNLLFSFCNVFLHNKRVQR